MMCVQIKRKAQVDCNANCRIESEGLLKVTECQTVTYIVKAVMSW